MLGFVETTKSPVRPTVSWRQLFRPARRISAFRTSPPFFLPAELRLSVPVSFVHGPSSIRLSFVFPAHGASVDLAAQSRGSNGIRGARLGLPTREAGR